MLLRRLIRPALFAILLALATQTALAADTGKISTPPKGDTPYEQKYYADPFYAEIEAAAKDKPARDVIAMIDLKIQDKPDRINAASLWLRDNSIGQRDLDRMDSLYFMAYADVTLQLARAYEKAGARDSFLDLLKTSVMSLYIYEMLGSIDALRCADETVLSAMRQDTLMPRLAKVNDAFTLLSKSDFDLFATTAFIADDKFAQRKPNEFICGLGAAKLSDLENTPGVVTLDAQNPATGQKSTRVIPPTGYKYTPALVDDTEWNKRREGMKSRLKKLWADRYERLKPGGTVHAPSPASATAPVMTPPPKVNQ